MKKLFYQYSNNGYSIHARYISSKTIKKEANGANKVDIYECDENQLEQRLDGFSAGKYITTLAIN